MWNRINVWLVAAACGMSMPAAGLGQERVRVTLPGETVVGVVTRMSPDVLALGLEGGGSRVFSRDEVLRTERGFERDQWHRGYLLGSFLGWVAGASVAYGGIGSDAEGNSLWALATPIGFIAGGIAGSRIGGSRKREAWETVRGWTGDPVRVTLSDSERIVGVVSRISRDGFELLLPGGPRLVAAGDVSLIERRTVQRQWKRGFVTGASAGGAIGLLLTPFGFGYDPSVGNIIGSKVLWVSLFGSFYGFAGAAVGGLFEREGWGPVRSLPRSPVTPGLLARMHTLPNGNSSLLVGARLQF